MRTPATRRDFLGSTAGAVAALATGPLIAQSDALPSRRVTIAIMGMNRGMELARAFGKQPGTIIKYACDVDSQRAERAAGRIQRRFDQRTKAETDFRRILDDPEVDAMLIATPNHWHAPATIMACAAGKHVYVEKPASHNPWEGEQMVAAARKHNRVVQLGAQSRSFPLHIEAIAKLHDGVIGNVYHARCWYNNRRQSIGIGKPADPPATLDYELWQGPAPRMPYLDNRVPYNWHWFWHWGNGELGNNGIHTIDVARWGLQAGLPISVASSGGRYAFQDDQQTPDTNVVTYEFPEGKQITWLSLSCNNHPDYSTDPDSDSYVMASFHGTNGTMVIEYLGDYQVYDARNRLVEEHLQERGGFAEGRNVGHAANFLEAVRAADPRVLTLDIAEGQKSTLLCHLGNIAYRTQRLLHCDPQTGRVLDDPEAMSYWQREYEPGWKPVV